MRGITTPYMDGYPKLDRANVELSHLWNSFETFTSLKDELHHRVKQQQEVLEEVIEMGWQAVQDLHQAKGKIDAERKKMMIMNKCLSGKLHDITQCPQNQNEAKKLALKEEQDRLDFYEKDYTKNGETNKMTQSLEDMAKSYKSMVKKWTSRLSKLNCIEKRLTVDSKDGQELMEELHEKERCLNKYLGPKPIFEEETNAIRYDKKEIDAALDWAILTNDLYDDKLVLMEKMVLIFGQENQLNDLYINKEKIIKEMQSIYIKIMHELVCIEVVQTRATKQFYFPFCCENH